MIPSYLDDCIWQAPEQYKNAPNWLLDPSSTTQKMRLACQRLGTELHVDVLTEAWGNALISERQFCRIATRERTWIREVILRSHEEPWMYAKTVIPESSLEGNTACLSEIGNQSLGDVLFSYPNIVRSTFEITQVRAHWTRRSIFFIEKKSLLLIEMFFEHAWYSVL